MAAITIDRHPADLAVTRYLVERGEEVLQAMEPDALRAGGHRRRDDHPPARHLPLRQRPGHVSVLDKDCRAHEVPNLYVVDGSFMPTSGGIPNTLTIMANAYRVADRLVQKVKSGKL